MQSFVAPCLKKTAPLVPISSVFTDFYVDHAKPLEALSVYKAHQQWVLGELLDGHEFLTIVPI
jgi:hypothetical protein